MDFPGGLVVKHLPAKAGGMGLIPGWVIIPWWRKWQPTPVFLPGESMDRGALWATVHGVTKELDTTECLKQQQITH